MTTPEPCTSHYGTRRHLSVNLAPARFGEGREGTSLCKPGGFPVDVHDQDEENHRARDWRGTPKDIASLPECRTCARVAAKLSEVAR